GVKARFADTDTQLKAKDALEAQFNKDDYVVALNLLSNSPAWLSSIGALPMYLGLDLRGGVHFLLQVDMRGALAKKMDAISRDIRNGLRERRIQYSGVTRGGQGMSVRFRDRARRGRGVDDTVRTMPDLELKSRDDGAESRIVATLKPEAQKRTNDFALQQNITTLRKRVDELGVAEPIVQQQGGDRIVVQ